MTHGTKEMHEAISTSVLQSSVTVLPRHWKLDKEKRVEVMALIIIDQLDRPRNH